MIGQTVHIPKLETERLVLRPHVAGDFDAYAALWAQDDAKYMGGPLAREAAWGWFASDVAQWALMGCGALAVTLRETGALVGQVVLNRLPHFPEPELGWMAFVEGRGYLTEAALRMREYAVEGLGWTRLVSYIDPENSRSIALAERLGAVRDDQAAHPCHDDLVYRHLPVAA